MTSARRTRPGSRRRRRRRDLLELRAGSAPTRVLAAELVEDDLGEVGDRLDPEPAAGLAWPAGRRGRSGPAGRRSPGRGPRAGRATARRSSGSPRGRGRPAPRRDRARRTIARRSSSEALRSFASNARGQRRVRRSRAPTTGSSERRARDERRIDRRERRLGMRSAWSASASSSSSSEQAPPDLAPDEVARVRPERLALAERDEEAAPAGDPDELGDEARLAHAGLGGDADDPPVARDRRRERVVEASPARRAGRRGRAR